MRFCDFISPVVILITAFALTSPAVGAQEFPEPQQVTPAGSRIPRWETPRLLSEKASIEVMHRFSACIAKTKTRHAVALLATAPGSKEQTRIVNVIIGQESSCLRDAAKMRIMPSVFRGALAEALEKLDPTLAQMQLAAVSPSETFQSFTAKIASVDEDGLDEEDKSLLVGRWLAYCSSHEGPDEVMRLLETSPGSIEEVGAFRTAEPLFSRCLLSGQKLTVNQLTMRALLAEAIYARKLSGADNA